MSRKPRLLGVKISDDYSAEARVFASLLGNRADNFEAGVIYHPWSGGGVADHAAAFEADSRVAPKLLRMGWEPNWGEPRAVPSRAKSMAVLAAAVPLALRYAQKFNPDVVYSSQQKADIAVAGVIARVLRRPQLVHLHYNVGPWLGGQAVRRIQEAAHVVTVSDYIRDQVLAVGNDSATTILNSVAVNEDAGRDGHRAARTALGLPQDAFVVGMVARLDVYKGQLDLIPAFRQSALPETARLVIVGGGAIESTLRGAAGEDARIHFLGRRDDVSMILPAFDAFAHPSTADPCPLAVLEACAAGLPVVAYRDGGAPEVVVHGKTGLLVDHKDVDALSCALQQLVDSPDAGRAMGTAARTRMINEFTPAAAGAKFAEVIREVCAANGRTLQN